jgi:16S rRNA (adenine1518-N6/adenine1519-N6)-dimethyltransferase
VSPVRPRYAQHFLADALVVDRLVDLIAPRAGQRMVEIGPGGGVLTKPLLAMLGSLDVVEIDTTLAAQLERQFAPDTGLRVHQADALAFNFAELAQTAQNTDGVQVGGGLRVVGNLPYNISTALLFHLLGSVAHIQDMVFMLQLEVAQRLVAQPGCSDYGRLSVMVQYHCDAELIFTVPPDAFIPPPAVHSAILRLTPSARQDAATDESRLAALVRKAFAQRRKTLRNALRTEIDSEALIAAGIDPGRRAETLSVSDFVRLSNQTG